MLNRAKRHKMGRFLGPLFFLFLTLSLGACATFWRAPPAVDPLPQVSSGNAAMDTAREACIRTCKRQNDICREGASPRFENYGDAPQGLGAGTPCDASLSRCLSGCR